MTLLLKFAVTNVEPGETVETTLFHLAPVHEEQSPGTTITVESRQHDLLDSAVHYYVQIEADASQMP